MPSKETDHVCSTSSPESNTSVDTFVQCGATNNNSCHSVAQKFEEINTENDKVHSEKTAISREFEKVSEVLSDSTTNIITPKTPKSATDIRQSRNFNAFLSQNIPGTACDASKQIYSPFCGVVDPSEATERSPNWNSIRLNIPSSDSELKDGCSSTDDNSNINLRKLPRSTTTFGNAAQQFYENAGVPRTPNLGTRNTPITPVSVGSVFSPSRGHELDSSKSRECAFCMMPLEVKFSSEGIETLKCKHQVHSQCLNELIKICGDSEEHLGCPSCGKSILTTADEKTERSSWSESFPASDSESSPFGGFMPDPSHQLSKEINFKLSNLKIRNSVSPIPSPTPSYTSVRNSWHSIGATHSSGSAMSFAQMPSRSSVLSNHSSTSLNSSLSVTNAESTSSSTLSGTSTKSSTLNSNNSCLDPGSSPIISSSHSTHSVDSIRSYQSFTSNESKNTSDSGRQKAINLAQLFDSTSSEIAYCGDCIAPINFFGKAELCEESATNNHKYRVIMGIQVGKPPLKVRNNGQYRSNAKDINIGLRIKKEVGSLRYRDFYLRSLNLGLLRLRGKMRVTSPSSKAINWNCFGYLFENYLVLINDNEVIKAVLDVKNGIDKATMINTDDNVVDIKFAHNSLPPLKLSLPSVGVAYMWLSAITDQNAQFPFEPSQQYLDDYKKTVMSNFNQSRLYRAPAEIVLCIFCTTEMKALTLQHQIQDVLHSLRSCDRLSVILAAHNQIIDSMPLRAPNDPEWQEFFNILVEVVNPMKSTINGVNNGGKSSNENDSPVHEQQIKTDKVPIIYQVDKIFEKAASIIADGRVSLAASSIIMASTGVIELSSYPEVFKTSQTRIHTIGLSEDHDPISLTSLAKHSKGSYHFAKNNDSMNKIVSEIVQSECQYVLKDVKLLLKPRLGGIITSCRGINVTHDPSTRGLEIDIGDMRTNDTRTFVMEISGSKSPVDEPLMKVLMQASNIANSYKSSFGLEQTNITLGIIQTENKATINPVAEQNILSFMIRTPNSPFMPESDSFTMLNVEQCLYDAHTVVEESINALLSENLRVAYNLFSSAVSRYNIELEKLDQYNEEMTDNAERLRNDRILHTVYDVLLVTFDKYCDAIMEKSKSTKVLILKLFQDLWLLEMRKSVLDESALQSMFLSEGLCS